MLVEIIHNQHLDLRELFAQHQEVLLQGELEVAMTSLNDFNLCHESHAKLEERYIFPLFETIKHQSKWDVSLYVKEHEKISHLFRRIIEDLGLLSEQSLSSSQLRRNIITILDKEKTLKGLIEHHESREEDAMLKELDEQLDSALIKELVSDLKFTWLEIIGSFK
tara:strand:- start:4196 stop:4690 length:495 start_codon:yes stop_codon:yes gene_type:complete